MVKQSNISRLAGIFVLLLFTLSVTPKRFLHDLLANHRDDTHLNTGKSPLLFASGFQCHADDLVVDAPYLDAVPFADRFIQPVFVLGYASPLYIRMGRPETVFLVRGPPATAFSSPL